MIKIVYMLTYDIAFQYFLIPFAVWSGIQTLISKLGICQTPHSEYFELLLVPLFFMTVAVIDTLLFIGFGWIQTLSIMTPFGFSKASPMQFLMGKLNLIIFQTIYYTPLIMFGMVIVINFKERLTIAFFFGSMIGKLYLLFVHPLLVNGFQRKHMEFPENQQ